VHVFFFKAAKLKLCGLWGLKQVKVLLLIEYFILYKDFSSSRLLMATIIWVCCGMIESWG